MKEPAENKRTLFVGNIDKGITGDEVSAALNSILRPHLQIELQDVPSPGILTTSAGYCFIEFDSHQLASMSFSLLSGAVVNGKELIFQCYYKVRLCLMSIYVEFMQM